MIYFKDDQCFVQYQEEETPPLLKILTFLQHDFVEDFVSQVTVDRYQANWVDEAIRVTRVSKKCQKVSLNFIVCFNCLIPILEYFHVITSA